MVQSGLNDFFILDPIFDDTIMNDFYKIIQADSR